ncbi:MAG: DNA repair protein RecN [Spirochaetia bacterium]
MLKELRVKNYALLGEMSVEFGPGLQVLTGETGAGKSLLIGALGLLLGNKASDLIIKDGEKQAEVSGVVILEKNQGAKDWLIQHEIEIEECTCMVQRLVKQQGKALSFIDGHPVSQQDLSEFMALLFDLHGQHENQSLYRKDNQRSILDASAGLQKKVQECGHLFAALKQQYEALKKWESEQEKLTQEYDYLKYSLSEIDEFEIKPDEKLQLQEKLKTLESAEKIASGLQTFIHLLSGSEGVLKRLKEAQSILSGLSHLLKKEDVERFKSAMIEIEDVKEIFKALQGSLLYSDRELEVVNARLSGIQRLEKKYGGSSHALSEFAQQARERLARIETGDEQKELLKKEIYRLEGDLHKLAQEISQSRYDEAQTLESKIQEILHQLSMPSAKFSIQVKEKLRSDGRKSIGATGIDDIEFLFAANVGQPLKPLKNIASGGEASRVLLAVKSVLSRADEIETLIFDEIDTGIGGNAALCVAQHMQLLSKDKQLLCITHLAVIAAHADSQMCLRKKESNGQTITEVVPVADSARIYEIARMLSGSQDEIALQHAQTLLDSSQRV